MQKISQLRYARHSRRFNELTRYDTFTEGSFCHFTPAYVSLLGILYGRHAAGSRVPLNSHVLVPATDTPSPSMGVHGRELFTRLKLRRGIG